MPEASEIRRGDAVAPSDRDFLRRIASEVPSAEPNHVMIYGHGAPPSLALSVVDTRRLLTLARTLCLLYTSPSPRDS